MLFRFGFALFVVSGFCCVCLILFVVCACLFCCLGVCCVVSVFVCFRFAVYGLCCVLWVLRFAFLHCPNLLFFCVCLV